MEEIATVYARSLFEVAKENDKLDDIKEQLDQFADELDENRELQVFFFSPYFSSAEKKDGIEQGHRGRRRALRPLPRAARRAAPHAGDLPDPARVRPALGGGEQAAAGDASRAPSSSTRTP